jgi:hypothetical protein
MKVKIGNVIHDSATGPVMVILSASDKANIGNMSEEATMYASFPDGWGSGDEMRAWMLPANSDIVKAEQIAAEEFDALIQDAFRYRWLRACNGGSIGITTFNTDPDLERALVEDEADAAIDAAMMTPNA